MKNIITTMCLFIAISVNAGFFLFENSTGKMVGMSTVNLWGSPEGYTVFEVVDEGTRTLKDHSFDGNVISNYSLEAGKIMLTKFTPIVSEQSTKSEATIK